MTALLTIPETSTTALPATVLSTTVLSTTALSTTVLPTTAVPAVLKGWHSDPWARHDLRYHDGHGWSEHVTHFGPVPCSGCRG